MPSSSAPIMTVRQRATFTPRAMTVFAVLAAVTISASSSAPTPIYHLYQEQIGLSPLLITIVFATYSLSLLVALLTVGSLSDYIGRRPVILAALILNVGAMVLFIVAGSAGMLIAARAVQGFATGIATTTLGAAILDTNRTRGPLLNSITAFMGHTVGSLGAGVLITFAPAPTQLVYGLLMAVCVIGIVLLAAMPETGTNRPGAFASLKPDVRVPQQARATFLRILPLNVAGWALGGFYLSLMPSVVRAATGFTSPLVGAVVVAALMITAVTTVVCLRDQPTARLLSLGVWGLALGVMITLAGVELQRVELMLGGTVVAGIGFGSSFSGILRALLPLAGPDERAGLLATYYVASFLSFSLPAVAAGILAPTFGLAHTAHIYGSVVILLSLISFAATRLSRTA